MKQNENIIHEMHDSIDLLIQEFDRYNRVLLVEREKKKMYSHWQPYIGQQ